MANMKTAVEIAERIEHLREMNIFLRIELDGLMDPFFPRGSTPAEERDRIDDIRNMKAAIKRNENELKVLYWVLGGE